MKKYIVATAILVSFVFAFSVMGTGEMSDLLQQKKRVEDLRQRVVFLIDIAGSGNRLDLVVSLEKFLLSADTILSKIEEKISFLDNNESFVECLASKGVIIYGSKTCPACVSLLREYDGLDNLNLIYVDCADERDRCSSEKITNYVPEVQIKGKLFDGRGTPENIAQEVGCKLWGRRRCPREMLTSYIPEVQIGGEIFHGWGSPENLAKETGCRL